jgi:hypothetical protein
MGKAEQLMGEYGETIKTYSVYERKGGKECGTEASFNCELGSNVGRAAYMTLRVFTEIYGFPADFALCVEEN